VIIMASYETNEFGSRLAESSFLSLRQQGVAMEAAKEAALVFAYLEEGGDQEPTSSEPVREFVLLRE
jgi:hypothetical protein